MFGGNMKNKLKSSISYLFQYFREQKQTTLSCKRFFILLIISLIITGTMLADTVAFKTVVTKNDMTVSGDFWLDVQMQITAGTSPRTLNSLTVDVYFGNQISYASADSWAYSFLDGYSRIASDLTTYIRVGTTGDNVNANGDGTPAGWNVTTSWQTVVTLKFTIATATSVNISINDATDAAAYFNNVANNPTGGGVTDWTVTNEDSGDVTLPVVLTAFSAVYTIYETDIEFVSVNWTTASETDVLGFNIYRFKEANFNTSEMVNDEIILGTNTTTSHNYTYHDEKLFYEVVQAGDIYWYWLETIELGGNSYVYEEPSKLIIPEDYEQIIPPDLPIIYGLYQNCPNPFNPSSSTRTKILFNLLNDSQVKINVYNIKGQLVKCIYNDHAEFDDNNPRPKVAYWDGCDVNGTQQQSGIYFYRMIVNGNEEEIKKLLLIR